MGQDLLVHHPYNGDVKKSVHHAYNGDIITSFKDFLEPIYKEIRFKGGRPEDAEIAIERIFVALKGENIPDRGMTLLFSTEIGVPTIATVKLPHDGAVETKFGRRYFSANPVHSVSYFEGPVNLTINFSDKVTISTLEKLPRLNAWRTFRTGYDGHDTETQLTRYPLEDFHLRIQKQFASLGPQLEKVYLLKLLCQFNLNEDLALPIKFHYKEMIERIELEITLLYHWFQM